MTLSELLDHSNIFNTEGVSQPENVWVFTIEIPMPEKKKDLKTFQKDAPGWVSSKMRKGAELKWAQIPAEKIPEFQKAKAKELGNWTREKPVKLAEKYVPPERVVRMRWIYTTESDGCAKARMIEDPDLGEIATTSPTMSRGQWSDREADAYTHCGVQLLQNRDGSVILNHAEYCSGIEQINFENRHDGEAISAGEKQQLRAVLGALQWRVYQTGPQHGARLSSLQSQLASPTVATLRETNKLVREVYAGRHVPLKYQKLHVQDLEDVTFVAWTDAAVGNRRDLSSSGGYIIAATEPCIREGKASPLNLIGWKSGKLPRVARSSLSAEIQAFSIAEEELMYTRLQWLEMVGHDIPSKDLASLVPKAPGVLVTDAKSLYDIIKKGVQNTSGLGLKEKYSVLDMLSVFQRLEKCKTETRWVHSEAQLA